MMNKLCSTGRKNLHLSNSCFINRMQILHINSLLILCFILSTNLYSQNFTRLTIDSERTWVRGVSWIDFDNDGDLDLYVCNNDYGGVATFVPNKNRNQLLINEGNDTFTPKIPVGMTDDTSFTSGQTWADYNNDGNIDLFLANTNSIYERFLINLSSR